MGWFDRKDSAPHSVLGKPRPSISSEAQAVILRARARRRLAGAVALVLAAIVVLPMVFDSEPARVSADIPIRTPDHRADRHAAHQSNSIEPWSSNPGSTAPADAASGAGQLLAPATSGVAGPVATEPFLLTPDNAPQAGHPAHQEAGKEGDRSTSGQSAPHSSTSPLSAGQGSRMSPSTRSEQPLASPSQSEPRLENRAEGRQTAKSESVPRTDDGRRAMALLEGRQGSGRQDSGRQDSMTAPSRAPHLSKGNFVLQIAAYTTQHDAELRRNQLHAAGVTNAYVQEVNLAGKQQYRLRVGPFPSSATAQAAQARLRTLGYDNGFIASQ